MRFKLWKIVKDGFNQYALQDTFLQSFEKRSWYLRDQSSYEQDNGLLVWKQAAHPMAVAEMFHIEGGEVIAEAKALSLLPAFIFK